MAVANFKAVIRERAGEIECFLARSDLGIGIGPERNAECNGEDRQQHCPRQFHCFSVLERMAVIMLLAAVFTFRTSSMLGARPAGKETNFSISVSCPLTFLTSGSFRRSGEMALIFDCMKLTSAGWRSTLAACWS